MGERRQAGEALIVAGVRISSPDRAQYPEAGIRKRDLVAYYERVAEAMLPHLRGRPLTLVRCPRGLSGRCFVQQHAAPGFPDAVRRLPVAEASGATREHVYVEDLAGILSCVQMGVLEFHGWGSRAHALEAPDRLVLDLDPDPSVPFRGVVEAARSVRARLLADGLASWPMLSGGKGVHVVVPVAGAGWPALRRLRPRGRAGPGGGRARALHRRAGEGRPHGADLRRPPAQRARPDRRDAVLDPRAAGGPGRAAPRLGRARGDGRGPLPHRPGGPRRRPARGRALGGRPPDPAGALRRAPVGRPARVGSGAAA
ncbi:hypothetical protein OPKNFCMD_4344 [Methylobacterium crusticola]|uniref:DNA ligase D polymerase domain-containing protein n=1 Tax=Methylobacterium crusticola TaxID=1697972 RepID=A0ABQ4R420_9HYPH|nr:hypothetical protein [Methylobacterium crusticola]GJD51589.1 hypothetical protein OPKNFCMD_4344 [Methylobacterium crusticola]